MRHWPTTVCALLALAACAGESPPPQTPVPVETAPVAATPTPTPTPSPSPTPTPSPTATPGASPTPGQLTEVPEAQHGAQPFPTPLVGGEINLKGKTVVAGAGNATARGAIDGNVYTEWNARQEVADNVWWQVDLGVVQKVSRLDILSDASPEVTVYFSVEASDDATTWNTLGGGKAFASNERPRWGTVILPSGTQTRYLRLVPTLWPRSWVAVWEIRLYP